MTLELLQQNWALFTAAGISVIVTAVIMQRLHAQSSNGQLKAQARAHGDAEKARLDAARGVERSRRKLQTLTDKADRVRPADLEVAKGALRDAEALLKIAEDKVLVETNLLRKVIFEQFPPRRHAALRAQYLPDDVSDGRPFSF